MNRIDISFVIPLRGRWEMRPFLEANIAKYFSNFSYEIIYVIQDDNKPFKVAQLRNVGFLYGRGEYLVHRDVDVMDMQEFNIPEVYSKFNNAFRATDKRQDVKIDNGNLIPINSPYIITGYGCYAVYKNDEFFKKNGFSNIFIGWGSEDMAAYYNFSMKTYNQCHQHIYHQTNCNFSNPHVKINASFEQKYKNGFVCGAYDGINQMTYKITNIRQISSNIKEIYVTDFGVVPDFKYIDLYNQHFSI